MVSSGVNELIWHFAGYLRLTPEVNGTPPVIYNGAGIYRTGGDEGMTHRGSGRGHDHPEHFVNKRLGFAELVAPPGYHWHLRPIGKLAHSPTIHVQLPKLGFPKLPMPALPPLGGGGGDEHVEVTYHNGGDQNLIYVPQVNWLINNNDVNAPSGVVAQNDDHAAKALSWMLHEASDASFGTSLQPDGTDTTGLQNWVNAHDSHPAQTYGHDSSCPQPETVINGVIEKNPTSEVHQPSNDVLTNTVAALDQALDATPTSLT